MIWLVEIVSGMLVVTGSRWGQPGLGVRLVVVGQQGRF